MEKHTPGPWRPYQRADGCDRWILASMNGLAADRQGRDFGHFQGWAADGITTEAEDEANAALIAAAPEMLEALKLAQGIIEEHGLCIDEPERHVARMATIKRLYDWWNFVALPIVQPAEYNPPPFILEKRQQVKATLRAKIAEKKAEGGNAT